MSISDFETKIYELNFQRNEHAHELRWKFMYAYVAGSLTFWGLIFTIGKDKDVPVIAKLLPALFAAFGWASYHALRQNMRVRGKVMQELEDKLECAGGRHSAAKLPSRNRVNYLSHLHMFFGL